MAYGRPFSLLHETLNYNMESIGTAYSLYLNPIVPIRSYGQPTEPGLYVRSHVFTWSGLWIFQQCNYCYSALEIRRVPFSVCRVAASRSHEGPRCLKILPRRPSPKPLSIGNFLSTFTGLTRFAKNVSFSLNRHLFRFRFLFAETPSFPFT